jgi:hypothetical protein
LITREGIRWIYSRVKIDGKEQGKGNFTFSELSNYSCSARTKLIRNNATLSKMNITDGTNFVIEMAFSYNISLDERYKKILRQWDASKMNIDQKIEILRKMGGTNPVTSAILGIAWLVVLIAVVVAVIRAFIG